MLLQNYTYHERNRSAPVPFRVLVRKNGAVTEFAGQTPAGKTGDRSNVEVGEFTCNGNGCTVDVIPLCMYV